MGSVFRWREGEKAPDERCDRLAASILHRQQERDLQLRGYEDVVGAIEALLFERDPIGVNFEENTDEYRSEAETITLRLRGAKDLNDVPGIVHETFVQWLGDDIAGPEEQYRDIAADVWEIWTAGHRRTTDP
jgi:hypothetical protein